MKVVKPARSAFVQRVAA